MGIKAGISFRELLINAHEKILQSFDSGKNPYEDYDKEAVEDYMKILQKLRPSIFIQEPIIRESSSKYR